MIRRKEISPTKIRSHLLFSHPSSSPPAPSTPHPSAKPPKANSFPWEATAAAAEGGIVGPQEPSIREAPAQTSWTAVAQELTTIYGGPFDERGRIGEYPDGTHFEIIGFTRDQTMGQDIPFVWVLTPDELKGWIPLTFLSLSTDLLQLPEYSISYPTGDVDRSCLVDGGDIEFMRESYDQWSSDTIGFRLYDIWAPFGGQRANNEKTLATNIQTVTDTFGETCEYTLRLM